eukprot:1146133-Pelagomonas_calceolata.AAC.3
MHVTKISEVQHLQERLLISTSAWWWEEGYYITAMAGALSGCAFVVMSKGTPYTIPPRSVR